ncbi:MAG TPA: pilus assembly protein PilM [Candidatus Rubrimentiphilum sp.]|nr:pilus assembly protein PilM [Candidatus Rubrimentiphilum sp.]
MRIQSLPLGVDLGTSRIRVVHSVLRGARRLVRAVAVRDVSAGAITSDDVVEPEYVAALLEDAVRELRTTERRCVGALGRPAAKLNGIRLPAMTSFERTRTAHFEASRYIEYPVTEAIVRIQRLGDDSHLWVLGIVRARTLKARVACLRRARLRVRGMSDEGCVLRRCLPRYDAVLDIGEYRSTLHLANSLETFQSDSGGAEITSAIESDLNLGRAPAETRKRIVGTAGAGERAKAKLIASLASLFQDAAGIAACQRVAVVGNGARLPGLLEDLMAATGSVCEFAVSHALDGEIYSKDVLCAGAPDWTLAAALAV